MTICPHDDDPLTCPPCGRKKREKEGVWELTDPETRSELIIAAYPGRCISCASRIHEGDSIWHTEEGWACEDCYKWGPL